MKPIDEAFAKTTKLLFGKELSPVDEYEDWLLKRIPKADRKKSCMSDKQLYVPNYSVFKYIPRDKVAGLDSLQELSQRKISFNEKDNLKEISKKMKDISTYIVEFIEGENQDVIDSSIYLNLYHAYKIIDCFNSKYIAYSFFTDFNEYVFGVNRNFHSKFCIHCYNSKQVSMAFEADACKNSSNIMFCHNCENVHDSLFCFNIKNKRYAIANTIVGREKYLEIKKMLQEYILNNLKNKKNLCIDIYSVGSQK